MYDVRKIDQNVKFASEIAECATTSPKAMFDTSDHRVSNFGRVLVHIGT